MLNKLSVVFHLWLFRRIFGRRQSHQLRYKLLGPETFAWVEHLDYGSAWFRPDEEGEVLRVRQGAFMTVMIMDATHTIRPILQTMQNGLDRVRASVESLPIMLKSFTTWAYIYIAQPLVDAKEGRRVCWTIAALNTGVWLLWHVPRLRPFMRASFSHNPLSGKSYTMLTSTFSHKSFLHLLFNSMALTSFGGSRGFSDLHWS